jgi:hypothetical protein
LILTIKLKNQELLKSCAFDHLAVFVGGFADVDDTWQLDPHVNVTFFSPISLSLQPFRLLGVVDASAQALLLADESQFSSPTRLDGDGWSKSMPGPAGPPACPTRSGGSRGGWCDRHLHELGRAPDDWCGEERERDNGVLSADCKLSGEEGICHSCSCAATPVLCYSSCAGSESIL